jgi:ADP-heptose:LPS heptosyltransferase
MNRLVYHGGALGDFLSTLPALALWRASEPGASISFLGRAAHGALARDAALVDEILDIDSARMAPLFAQSSRAAADEILGRFSEAIIFAQSTSSLLGKCRKQIRRVLWHPPFPATRIPIVEYHLSLLVTDASTRRDQLELLRSRPPLAAPSKRLPLCEGAVILHPGSGSLRKNWPIDRMEALGERLHDDGFSVGWLRGPAEQGLKTPDYARLIETPSLLDLAHELRNAVGYVGNDSGVTHCAAMSGCATVALFGPSDRLIWRPFGPRVRIIASPTPCSPCHPGAVVDGCDCACMHGISVDTVYRTIQALID